MHAAPDNGFSLMTDCPAVTHFMLNSFSLFHFTSVILWGVGLGGGGGSLPQLHCPGERRSLPPVTIPRLCFYCIVFCIIVLLVKGLGDTAICQVHLAKCKGITADPAGPSQLSNRRGAPCLQGRFTVEKNLDKHLKKHKNKAPSKRISNAIFFILFF